MPLEETIDILGYPSMKFGFGAVAGLARICSQRNLGRPMILTDAGLVEHGVVQMVLDAQPTGFDCVVFDGIPPNPNIAGVLAAAALYKQEKCDGIVALGGGSVIDSAKALRVAVSHPRPLIDYMRREAPIEAIVPLCIAVPTTAGTGAELTPAGGIHPEDHLRVLPVISPYLKPDISICDPGLTLSLPPYLTAATGYDAVSHCIDSYFAAKFDPILDGIALNGIRRVNKYIERAVNDGTDREARWHMMLASVEGGMCMYKGLGIMHALAITLGDEGLHHGHLCAVVTPATLRYHVGKADDRLQHIADAFDAPNGTSADKAAEAFIDRLQLERSLVKLGYQNRDIVGMAEGCTKTGQHATAKFQPTVTEYSTIISELLN